MLKLDWGESQVWMNIAAEAYNKEHPMCDSDGRLMRHRYPKENLITTQAKRNLSSRSGIGGVLSAT